MILVAELPKEMAEMIIDPVYSIGIDEMDTQHARWIQLIEEFKAVASGHLLEQSCIAATEKALLKLMEYTKSHFASEEQFIAAHQYPDLEVHKKHHRELEREVLKLHNEIVMHTSERVPLKLNLLITIWLMEHITQEDAKYASFILKKTAALKK
jgi:hemerythrin